MSQDKELEELEQRPASQAEAEDLAELKSGSNSAPSNPSTKKSGLLPARRKAGEAPKQMALPKGFQPPTPVKRVVLEEESALSAQELALLEAGEGQELANFEENRAAEVEASASRRIEPKVSAEQLWEQGVSPEQSSQQLRYKPPTNWLVFIPWTLGVLGVGWGFWMMGKAEEEKSKFDTQVQDLQTAQTQAASAIRQQEDLKSQLAVLQEEQIEQQSLEARQIVSTMEENAALRRELIQAEDEYLALQAKYEELSEISAELIKGGAVGLAQIVSMQAVDGRNAGQSVLAWDALAGVGRLRWDGIPVLENGLVYQVWAKEPTDITSLGMVSAKVGDPSSRTLTIMLPEEVAQEAKTEEILVTIEPAGGSEMPSGVKIMATPVSR